VLHSFFGVSRVPFWTHFWGSLVGYLLPLLVVSYLGAEIIDESGSIKPQVFPILGGFLACALLVTAVVRTVMLRKRNARPQPDSRG
jgi:uncharacterized membrane protein YdjX (TVP38/TMEM64 family)